MAIETPEGQYVSPSTGRLRLASQGSVEVVAQEAARTAGTPVIPGSGIKGAVRNLYELLSFSCNVFESRQCSAGECCDACSLFGMVDRSWSQKRKDSVGRSGRLGFDDARPAKPGSVSIEVRSVPVPWPPQKPQGDVSVYDLEEAQQYDRDRKVYTPSAKELSREVFFGRLETRMTFWNATQEELGRVLLCMGVGGDEATRFLLRLGGVKYDGKGAVAVRPLVLVLVKPARKILESDSCQREVANWISAAKSSEWAATFWTRLEDAAKLLRGPAR